MTAGLVLVAGVLLAAGPTSGPDDDVYLRALDLLYDGSTDTAIADLSDARRENPEDPLAHYFEALALVWKIEQRPESTALDGDLHARLDSLIALAEDRLRDDPEATRARLVKGGAHALRSRLYMFRSKSRDAARAAKKAREQLLLLKGHDAEWREAELGVGLYDYYVDVLPRVLKLLRFLSGLPGGDRERGLAAIQDAKEHSTFHHVEAAVQLYEIYAYYERKPDRALAEIRQLHERYPGSPLWALKLADHLRDRLGRYAESAAVAREILHAAQRREPNFGPVTAALARLALGEALMFDLRLAEARRGLLGLRDGLPEAPFIGPRARWLLGRTLELEGDREAALVHYRAAALSPEREVRIRAEQAVRSPVPPAEVNAISHLADGRREREAGRLEESFEAYRLARRVCSECLEARVRVAEEHIRHGRVTAAKEEFEDLEDSEGPSPPWVRPWTWLLRGYLYDLAGEREAAEEQYNKVLQEPYGDRWLLREAKLRRRHPFRSAGPPDRGAETP